ncbi:MAG: hypothetical protein IH597_15800 [Bacteroidales bacterium]|nr:hypothetical protein [Bacteroidales bacterium]
MKRNGAILLMSLAFSITMDAAEPRWLIQQRTIIPYSSVSTRQLHISGQKIRLQEQSHTLILDLKSLELFFILNPHELYWQGTVDEFRQGFSTLTPGQIAEAVRAMPESERERFKEFLLESSNQFSEDEDFSIHRAIPDIIKTNDLERIAGYRSFKYRVVFEDEVVEDIFIAPAVKPGSAFSMSRFYEYLHKLAMPSASSAYVLSSEYLKLLEIGFPMKSIKYNGYVTEINEVTEIKKLVHYPALYLPPVNFTSTSLSEILLLQMKDSMEENEE